jgi:hypothetical protein
MVGSRTPPDPLRRGRKKPNRGQPGSRIPIGPWPPWVSDQWHEGIPT